MHRRRALRRGLLLATLLTLLSPTVLRAEPLTAETLWRLARLGTPAVSADGRQAVVPVTRFDERTGAADTRLWLIDIRARPRQRPLTAVGLRASSPVFSPDGQWLAFLSKRDTDDRSQVYVLPIGAPGEATRLTDMPTGARALRWVGEHIYFLSHVWPGQSVEQLRETLAARRDDPVSARVFDTLPFADFDRYVDPERAYHLFRVPAAGGEVEAISAPTGLALPVRTRANRASYDVAADESYVAFVTDARSGDGVWANDDIVLLDLDSGMAQNLTAANPAEDAQPQFSPDGRTLAFLQRRIAGFYGDRARLRVYDLASGETRRPYDDWDRSITAFSWWSNSNGIYAGVADAGSRRLFRLPLRDGSPRALTGAGDFRALQPAGENFLVALKESPLHPAQLVRINTRTGRHGRLDAFNREVMADVTTGRYESVTISGADGAPIQMWVHYPPGFDPARRYPLLMLLHGGPHGAATENFHYRWNSQLFAGWGYVVAWPNFHGSIGFGQAFADSINPDWASKPYADVLAAADWLAAQPWIDAERMVAGGASYGGFLASVLLGRQHPFKALIMHAPVYDLYAQTASDFPIHVQRFGGPWRNPALFQSLSPHLAAGAFSTPSLILHGEHDLRVPVGQSFELFRALQTQGIPSRLVYFPDEHHWILKRGNAIFWYQQVRDWLARFASPTAAGD